MGQVAFKSWLNHLVLLGINDKKVLNLSLPSRFLMDWVIPHYGNRIEYICRKYCRDITSIKIVLAENNIRNSENKIKPSIKNMVMDDTSPLDPRFTFDNFVVGKSNEFAFAAAKRVSESSKVVFNPLFLFGGVGLGKTHLMHAVAWDILLKRSSRKVVYLSAEKFMYEFVKSLRFRDTMSFKEKFRSVDVLMIDDIQFIAGKDSTQ
ncbi:MAG: chromosomal replication initiation protein DnaA, partial [Rickettsiales bacterium]|nr:chromosomal replication initiation protein DnaA [Rickettsiales bacterium]